MKPALGEPPFAEPAAAGATERDHPWGFIFVGLAIACLASLAACGGGAAPPASSCPNDVPAGCASPDTAPHFASDILPLINDRCGICHAPGGVSKISLQDYAGVASQRTHILFQLQSCLMPPTGAPPLTAPERQSLFTWILCGSRND